MIHQKKANSLKTKVFVSHSWNDKTKAEKLTRALEEFQSVDVWMDSRILRPGDQLWDHIETDLKGMDYLLLVWSQSAKNSRWVQEEVKTCIEGKIPVIPCIFSLNSEGKPDPTFDGKWEPVKEYLYVDFSHFSAGFSQLIELILNRLEGNFNQLRTESAKDESACSQDSGMKMLNRLREILHELGNKLKRENNRPLSDEERQWINWAIRDLENHVSESGDIELARWLLALIREQGNLKDPANIILLQRLENLVGQSSSSSSDDLANRIAAVLPAGTENTALAYVQKYIDSATTALFCLSKYIGAVGSPAGLRVVNYLNNYLQTDNDLIPDRLGQYGKVDDAWLILNTIFPLIANNLVPTQAIPIDWNVVQAADPIVCAIIPPTVLANLASIAQQMLQDISLEASSYQTYNPQQMPSFEDAMAQHGLIV